MVHPWHFEGHIYILQTSHHQLHGWGVPTASDTAILVVVEILKRINKIDPLLKIVLCVLKFK